MPRRIQGPCLVLLLSASLAWSQGLSTISGTISGVHEAQTKFRWQR